MNNTDGEIACCFTGHRTVPVDRMEEPRQRLRAGIAYLRDTMNITTYYAGGALGFDYEKRKVMRSEILCALYENENQKNHFA